MNKKRKLMKPPHPGIRWEILHELELSLDRAAEVLGVRPAIDILTEEAALSPEIAMRLEEAFGLSMAILLRMQAWHDGYTMRQRAEGNFTPRSGRDDMV
jgi:antitoxin HigA-1